MRFDVNQTDFPSEFQRDIWQRGIKVMPLEISLTGIDDPDTREGLTQVYNFTLDLFRDMYDNPEKYKPDNYKDINTMENFLRTAISGQFDDSRLNLLASTGYSRSGDGNIINDKYPLLLKYASDFISLVFKKTPKAPGKNWGIILKCDFRCFSKVKTRGIEDLLYTLSDQNRVCFKELHDYVTAKGAKKEPGRYRYKHKNEHIICFDWEPSILISYRLKNGNSLKKFIAEVNIQPDKNELLSYIQNKTSICNHCGTSTCKAYVEFFICTPNDSIRHHHFKDVDKSKIKIEGIEFNRGCFYHPDEITQPFTSNATKIMKRLIDIRFAQIENA